jgi:hypothetical protein
MIDTYGIAKNLAPTGALGYSNKDVSAMLKLVSQLSPEMDELIRADRDRFAIMKKALGGITGCGALAHVPSVLDTLPKDLYPLIAPISSLTYDRFLSNTELRDLIFRATHGASPPSRSEAERRRSAFYVIDGGLNS